MTLFVDGAVNPHAARASRKLFLNTPNQFGLEGMLNKLKEVEEEMSSFTSLA